MATFKWVSGQVPQNMKITQVYGVVFNKDGRILLLVKNKPNGKVYSLAGGKPEKNDDGICGTVKRELFEELNTKIKNPIMFGYQQVDEENGTPAYAQVRMVASLDEVGEKRPDPDNGETYDRLLTTPQRAIELLGWGESGKQQIENAVIVAEKEFGICLTNHEDEWI